MSGYGVMFHHFSGLGHPNGQGAITADMLAEIIEYVSLSNNILSAQEWLTRSQSGSLKKNDACLTFDDGLRCQYDLALPVLESYDLTAFWFIYTSPLLGGIQRLELYRYFRDTCFDDIDAFYMLFNKHIENTKYSTQVKNKLAYFDADTYLIEFPFYSKGDRIFRYIRDQVLGPDGYFQVMDSMIEEMNIDKANTSSKLFVDAAAIKILHQKEHIIGLHSHTHPTRLEDLSELEQLKEYHLNKKKLREIVEHEITVMSHPCNSYNEVTLKLLKNMGISVGFRSNMANVKQRTTLEYPREDHTNLLNNIRHNN